MTTIFVFIENGNQIILQNNLCSSSVYCIYIPPYGPKQLLSLVLSFLGWEISGDLQVDPSGHGIWGGGGP